MPVCAITRWNFLLLSAVVTRAYIPVQYRVSFSFYFVRCCCFYFNILIFDYRRFKYLGQNRARPRAKSLAQREDDPQQDCGPAPEAAPPYFLEWFGVCRQGRRVVSVYDLAARLNSAILLIYLQLRPRKKENIYTYLFYIHFCPLVRRSSSPVE